MRHRAGAAANKVTRQATLPSPVGSDGDGRMRREDRDLGFFGQHHAHDLLEGEQVDARTPALEIVASAVPLTGVEADVMDVVVATEREGEAVDRDSIELSRVAISLFDLADQGTVHRRIPPSPLGAFTRPSSG